MLSVKTRSLLAGIYPVKLHTTDGARNRQAKPPREARDGAGKETVDRSAFALGLRHPSPSPRCLAARLVTGTLGLFFVLTLLMAAARRLAS